MTGDTTLHRPRSGRIGDGRLRIEALTVDDCTGYIEQRLAGVGCDSEIFTRDAISPNREASLGTLREINRICQAALAGATEQGRTLIERTLVGDVLKQ